MFADGIKSAMNGLAGWWYEHRDVSREQVVQIAVTLLWVGVERVASGGGSRPRSAEKPVQASGDSPQAALNATNTGLPSVPMPSRPETGGSLRSAPRTPGRMRDLLLTRRTWLWWWSTPARGMCHGPRRARGRGRSHR